MYVREVRIRSIKLLGDVTVSFLRDGQPRMWTALIGENGLCKTTFLQAIALAASGRDRANQLANVPSFPDLRRPDLITVSYWAARLIPSGYLLRPLLSTTISIPPVLTTS